MMEAPQGHGRASDPGPNPAPLFLELEMERSKKNKLSGRCADEEHEDIERRGRIIGMSKNGITHSHTYT